VSRHNEKQKQTEKVFFVYLFYFLTREMLKLQSEINKTNLKWMLYLFFENAEVSLQNNHIR